MEEFTEVLVGYYLRDFKSAKLYERLKKFPLLDREKKGLEEMINIIKEISYFLNYKERKAIKKVVLDYFKIVNRMLSNFTIEEVEKAKKEIEEWKSKIEKDKKLAKFYEAIEKGGKNELANFILKLKDELKKAVIKCKEEDKVKDVLLLMQKIYEGKSYHFITSYEEGKEVIEIGKVPLPIEGKENYFEKYVKKRIVV